MATIIRFDKLTDHEDILDIFHNLNKADTTDQYRLRADLTRCGETKIIAVVKDNITTKDVHFYDDIVQYLWAQAGRDIANLEADEKQPYSVFGGFRQHNGEALEIVYDYEDYELSIEVS